MEKYKKAINTNTKLIQNLIKDVELLLDKVRSLESRMTGTEKFIKEQTARIDKIEKKLDEIA